MGNRLICEPRISNHICEKSQYTLKNGITSQQLSSKSTQILPHLNYPKHAKHTKQTAQSSSSNKEFSFCNNCPSKQNSIITDSVTDKFAAFGKQLKHLEEEVRKIEVKHILLQEKHLQNHSHIDEDVRKNQHREIMKEAVRQVEQAQLAREEAERIARKKKLEQYQEDRREKEKNMIKNSKIINQREFMSGMENLKDDKKNGW